MILTLCPKHLDSYTLWLQNRQYQSNTVRNYLQDLKAFLAFSKNQISLELTSTYIQEISSKNNSPRYLASLSTFCQFLLDQHLTDVNLFKQAKKHLSRSPSLDLDKLLIQYQQSLIKAHKSDLTIKNYLNDIHQYFNWLKTPQSGEHRTAPLDRGALTKKPKFNLFKKLFFVSRESN